MDIDPTDQADPTDPTTAANSPAAASSPVDPSDVENGIVEALKKVFDPEIPVNIYELGLIYDVDIQEGGKVQVKMTLTSPGCPVAGSLPGEVKARVEAVPGVVAGSTSPGRSMCRSPRSY
ncbi:MAG TPA: iron-sulfur cluster assembly protein, partial [Thermoanaerobaculia bacterium]|nr:iron-sulfur cluster assembly protein [Thermoanaerobaculia bacterium]